MPAAEVFHNARRDQNIHGADESQSERGWKQSGEVRALPREPGERGQGQRQGAHLFFVQAEKIRRQHRDCNSDERGRQTRRPSGGKHGGSDYQDSENERSGLCATHAAQHSKQLRQWRSRGSGPGRADSEDGVELRDHHQAADSAGKSGDHRLRNFLDIAAQPKR